MVKIIAEIGSNWDPARPRNSIIEMIEAAAEGGATHVKLQDWAPIRQTNRPAGWKKRCAPWTLPYEHLPAWLDCARTLGLGFFCSAFTVPAVRRARGFKYDLVKIASSEIRNEALLRAAGNSGLPVMISTGEASGLGDVAAAVFDVMKMGGPNAEIILMHCIAEYPTVLEHLELWRIPMLAGLGYEVGWSSHVAAEHAALAAAWAVELGATWVEAHLRVDGVTVDSCPDNGDWSLWLDEFEEMVTAVRDAEG